MKKVTVNSIIKDIKGGKKLSDIKEILDGLTVKQLSNLEDSLLDLELTNDMNDILDYVVDRALSLMAEREDKEVKKQEVKKQEVKKPVEKKKATEKKEDKKEDKKQPKKEELSPYKRAKQEFEEKINNLKANFKTEQITLVPASEELQDINGGLVKVIYKDDMGIIGVDTETAQRFNITWANLVKGYIELSVSVPTNDGIKIVKEKIFLEY